MIEKILILNLLLCILSYSESTNLVGVSKNWFMLVDGQSAEQYTNAVNRLEATRPTPSKLIMSTSGRVVSTNIFSSLLSDCSRLYFLCDPRDDNKKLVVLSMPPFPNLGRARFSYVDSFIFEPLNTVEFKAKQIKKEAFEKLISDLFIWRSDKDGALHKPRRIFDEENLKQSDSQVYFFMLEDIYSFSTFHPERRRNDWLSPFRHYEQRINIQEKKAGEMGKAVPPVDAEARAGDRMQ